MSSTTYSVRQNLLVWIGFAAFFLLYFIIMPLQGSLPGSGDTWLYVGLFNSYGNDIAQFFGKGNYTTSLYPESASYLFGEPSFAAGAMFLFFKLICQSDIWSYYLLFAAVFSANAFSVYFLTRVYKIQHYGAILAGIAFSCSPFIFSNTDNQNAIAFFPGILAMAYMTRYMEEKKDGLLLITAVLLSSQIYFSGYLFLFTIIGILLIALSRLKEIPSIRVSCMMAIVTLTLIFPYLWLYFIKGKFGNSYDIARHFHAESEAALHIPDLITVSRFSPQYQYFHYGNSEVTVNELFPGIVIIVLSVIAIIQASRQLKYFALSLIIAGIILAIGPQMSFAGMSIHTPLFYLDQISHYSQWMRIPIRAYILVTLGMAVLCGFSFDYLMEKMKNVWKFVCLVIPLLLFLECAPVPFAGKSFDTFERLGQDLKLNLAKLDAGNVLQLPSTILSPNMRSEARAGDSVLCDINELQREHLYMYFQSQFERNCINGSNGFIPRSRLMNDTLIKKIDTGDNMDQLLHANSIKYIVFHKKLLIRKSELQLLGTLQKNEQLKLVKEDNDFAIFQYH